MAKVNLSDDVKKRLQEKGYNYQSNESRPASSASQDRYYEYQEQQLERQGGRKYAETTLKPKEYVTLTNRSGSTVRFNARDERVNTTLQSLANLHSSYTSLSKMSRDNSASWRSSLQKWGSQAALLRNQIRQNSKLSDKERETLIEYLDDMGKGVTSGFQQSQAATEQRRLDRMSPDELQRYRENNIALWQRLSDRYGRSTSVSENPQGYIASAYTSKPLESSRVDLKTSDMYSRMATEEANYAYREVSDKQVEEVSRAVHSDPESFTNTAEAVRRLSAYYQNPGRADSYETRESDFAEVNKALVANGKERILETDDDETKRRKIMELETVYSDAATRLGIDYEDMLTRRQELAIADESVRNREEFNAMLQRNPNVLPLMNAIALPTSLTTGAELVANVVKGMLHGNETDLSTYRPITDADMTETAFVADVQKQTSEEIMKAIEEKGGSEFMQQFGQFGYNVAFSVAQSMLAAGVSAAAPAALADTELIYKLLGETGLTLMATSAGSQTMLDTLQKGGSVRDACVLGVTSAIFEAAAEKLPLDNLTEMLTGDLSNANFVLQLLKQSGLEGAEEVITEIANTVTDIAVMGYSSDFYQNIDQYITAYMAEGMTKAEAEARAKKQAMQDLVQQVGMAGLAGAVSGAISGGIGMVTGRIGSNQKISTDANTVYDVALQTKDIQHVGAVLADGYKANDRRAKAVIEEMSKKTGKSVAELTQTDENGRYTGSMTAEDFGAISKREFNGIYSRMVRGYESAERKVARDYERAERQEAAADRKARRKGVLTTSDTTENVHKLVKINDDGTVTYENYRGEEKTAENMETLPIGTGASEIVASMRDTGENSVENNNAMMNAYESYLNSDSEQPVGPSEFADAWYDTQERLSQGMTIHEALSSYEDNPTLQQYLTLAEGVQQKATQRNIIQTNTTRRGTVSLGIDNESRALLEARGLASAPRAAELTANQRLAVSAAQVVADKGGMRTIFFSGDRESYYDKENGIMFINIGEDATASALKDVAHESVHHLAEYSQEGYNAMRDYIRNKMGGDDFSSAVFAALDKYGWSQDNTKQYAWAVEEVVAEKFEDMYASKRGVDEIKTALQEHKSVLKELLGHIKGMFDGISKRLKEMRRTGRGLDVSSDEFDEMFDLYDKALTEAGRAYKAGAQTTDKGIRQSVRGATDESSQTQEETPKKEPRKRSPVENARRGQRQIDRTREERNIAAVVDDYETQLARANVRSEVTTLSPDYTHGRMLTQKGAERVVDMLFDAMKNTDNNGFGLGSLAGRITKKSFVNSILQAYNHNAHIADTTEYEKALFEELYTRVVGTLMRANVAGERVISEAGIQILAESVSNELYYLTMDDGKALRKTPMDYAVEETQAVREQAEAQRQRSEQRNARLVEENQQLREQRNQARQNTRDVRNNLEQQLRDQRAESRQRINNERAETQRVRERYEGMLSRSRAREIALQERIAAEREERQNRRRRLGIYNQWQTWIRNVTNRRDGINRVPDDFENVVSALSDLVRPETIDPRTGAVMNATVVRRGEVRENQTYRLQLEHVRGLREALRRIYGENIRHDVNIPNSGDDALDLVLSQAFGMLSMVCMENNQRNYVANMDAVELEALNQCMRVIYGAIRNQNRAFTATIREANEDIREYSRRIWRTQLDEARDISGIRKLFYSQGFTNPRLVRVMEEFNPNGALTKTIDEGRNLAYRAAHERMQILKPFYDLIYGDPADRRGFARMASTQDKVNRETEFKRKCETLVDYGLTDTNGRKVRITEMEALYLWMFWQRENTQGTLMHSIHDNGVRVPNHQDIRDNKSMSLAYDDGVTVMPTEEQIKAMYETFDEFDRTFIRMASQAFNGRCADLVNMGAAPVLGFTVARERAYVPGQAWLPNSQLSSDKTSPSHGYLIQSGILKSPTGGSSAPIKLQNLNTILMDHVQAACRIGYLLQWELDAKRIGTTRISEDRNGSFLTLDQALVNKWSNGNVQIGQAYSRAINEIIYGSATGSVNEQAGIWDDRLAMLTQMYSKYVFNANPVAAWKQLSGGPLATAYNGWWQTVSALPRAVRLMANTNARQRLLDQIAEHSSIVWDRSFDMDYGKLGRIAEWVLENVNTDANPGRIMRTLAGIMEGGGVTLARTAEKITMHDIMHFMDIVAIISLWQPTINATRNDYHGHGAADMSNPEFAQTVTERFERMISETQPMDEDIYRPQIFKGKKRALTRNVYLFMSPAFQQYGHIHENFGELAWARRHGTIEQRRTASRRALLSIAGLAYSTAMNSLIMTAFAYLRGKPKKYRDEKTGRLTIWSVARQVGIDAASEFAESILPFTKGYITDNVIDLLAGKKTLTQAVVGVPKSMLGDATWTYIENIQHLIESMEKVGESLVGEDNESAEEVRKRTDALYSGLQETCMNLLASFGVPVTNAFKIFDVIKANIINPINGKFFTYDEDYTLNADQIRANLLDALKNGKTDVATQMIDEVYQTELDDYAEKYWADFADNPEMLQRYAMDARKDTYTTITRYIKKLWEDGKITDDQAVDYMNRVADMSQVRSAMDAEDGDMIGVENFFKVQEWTYDLENQGRDVEGYSRWTDLFSDYKNGRSGSAEDRRLREIYKRSFKASGGTDADADAKYEADRKSGIKKFATEALNSGEIGFDRMSKILTDVGCSGTEIMTAYSKSLQQGVEDPLTTSQYAAKLLADGRDSAYTDYVSKWSKTVDKDVVGSVRGALENMLTRKEITANQFESVARAHSLYDTEVKMLKQKQKAIDAEEDTIYEQAAEALRNGNTSTFESLESEYVKAAVADGDLEDEAKKVFDRAVINQVKDEYLKGVVSEADFARLYEKYSGDEEYEIPLMLHAYADKKEHPDSEFQPSYYSTLKRIIQTGDQNAMNQEITWLMTTGDRYANSIASSLRGYAEQVGKLRRLGRTSEADNLRASIQYCLNLIQRKIDWSKYDN